MRQNAMSSASTPVRGGTVKSFHFYHDIWLRIPTSISCQQRCHDEYACQIRIFFRPNRSKDPCSDLNERLQLFDRKSAGDSTRSEDIAPFQLFVFRCASNRLTV